jgi:hypothetical protein
MGTRRENRPVSITGACGLLTLDMRLPGTRFTKPCARDPPSLRRRSYQATSRARGACRAKPARGRPPRSQGHKRGERRCSNIASPACRTRRS